MKKRHFEAYYSDFDSPPKEARHEIVPQPREAQRNLNEAFEEDGGPRTVSRLIRSGRFTSRSPKR